MRLLRVPVSSRSIVTLATLCETCIAPTAPMAMFSGAPLSLKTSLSLPAALSTVSLSSPSSR